MSDHIFSSDTFMKLGAAPIQSDEIILAIDSDTQLNKLVDMDDVTKVLVDNNKIIDIGKNVKKFNAFDIGMFLCTPAIFSAIESSITAHNDSSLSGGVKVLAKHGKARGFDMSGDFWIDVDDNKTLKKANKYLLQQLKKRSDGPVSRYINRPISAAITKFLVKSNISPNQVSFFCFFLALAASGFFLMGSYVNLVIGGVLAQISSIVDGCDGEIARLKFISTKMGGWLDAVLDRYADGFLLFGLTYYLFISSGKAEISLFIGFLAIIGSFLNSYTADKYDSFMEKRLEKMKFSLRLGRDIRVFIIFIGALLNQPFGMLLILAILTNAENVRRVIMLYKNG
jgi:CDP-L-myo-inositol myo-inositolphosphotransferase